MSTTKICKTCKAEKDLVEFAKNKNCADGHLTECKACNGLYRQQNAEHRASVELARRRRNGVNPKFTHDTDEQKREAHILACRRWQQRNKHLVKRYMQTYADNNPGMRTAYSTVYKARKLRAVPTWANFELISDIYRLAQEVTETTGVVHVVDHYYPLRGQLVCGLHVHENLQVITYDENARKHNKHPDEFYST